MSNTTLGDVVHWEGCQAERVDNGVLEADLATQVETVPYSITYVREPCDGVSVRMGVLGGGLGDGGGGLNELHSVGGFIYSVDPQLCVEQSCVLYLQGEGGEVVYND